MQARLFPIFAMAMQRLCDITTVPEFKVERRQFDIDDWQLADSVEVDSWRKRDKRNNIDKKST